MAIIIFVDALASSNGLVLNALAPDPNVEIVELDGALDGVEQMAAYLDGRSDIEALHLVATGSPGAIALGTAQLDAASLATYAAALATIAASLLPEADLLVYGSNIGSGTEGADFIAALAAATGADVAASDDLTGSAAPGGDWDLEVATGTIETTVLSGKVVTLVDGSEDDDSLAGTSGADQINGLGGDDVLSGGLGDDALDGGEGWDAASYANAAGPVVVDLMFGTSSGAAGQDTLTNIEDLIGSSYGDVLRGDNGENLIRGGSGDDKLVGRGGNDTLDGGSGFDEAWYYTLADAAGHRFWFDRDAGTLDITGQGDNAAYAETDTLVSVELISGTAYDDVIVDAVAGATMYLSGWTGNDTLQGNAADVDYAVYSGLDGSRSLLADLGTGTVVVRLAADDSVLETDTLIDIRGLWGSNGNDSLAGAATDDVFRGYGGNDLIDGRDGMDIVDYRPANAAISVTLADSGDTLVDDQRGGTDTLRNIEGISGSTYADAITGNSGDNWLRGRGGNDTLDGAGGTDTANYATAGGSVTASLAAGSASDGEGGTDTLLSLENLRGGDYDDTLEGNAGANRLDGGAAFDTVRHAYLSDAEGYRFTLGSATLAIAGRGANGAYAETDTLISIEQIQATAGADVIVDQVAWRDMLIVGGLGNDTIQGQAGDIDFASYAERGASVSVVANLAAGSVVLSDAADLGYAETDTLIDINGVWGGAGDDVLTGNAAENFFRGNAGDDAIDGGLGFDVADYRTAGAAVQITLAESGATSVDDQAGGTDTLVSIEGITATMFDDTLVGNSADNGFRGRAGNDSLDGGAGVDFASYRLAAGRVVANLATGIVQDGEGGIDTLSNIEELRGGAYADTLIGSDNAGGVESFEGREGDDSIDGRGGLDRADYRDSRAAVTVNLATGRAADGMGGTDTLAGIENARGSRDFNDVLTGNALANKLEGLGGSDTLDGGAGSDKLYGGAGNDTYVVDSSADLVSESSTLAGEIDTVKASVSWTLGSNLEKLILLGSAALDGSGNGLANTLTGNAASNVLNGGAGADTLIGGRGGDTYVVDNAGDVITESSTVAGEIDSVWSATSRTLGANLENLLLTGSAKLEGTGNTLANKLTGNAAANTLKGLDGADTLSGMAGNDVLDGGSGKDVLAGGSGADRYVFTSALSRSTNVDRISDFNVADDRIDIDNAVFTKAGGLGVLSAAAWRVGSAAADSSDRIVYDKASGSLYYDADGSGSGAAVLFATVSAGTALTAGDFWVV